MRVLSHAHARPTRRTSVPARLAAAVAAVSLASTACGEAPADDRPAAAESSSPSGNVVRLDRTLPKPELALTDDRGRAFDLAADTAGKPTLMYFGYTHCPDVCPTTMADIANSVKKLPEADQERLRIVFVTTDPERDTPKRLHTWLAAFDSRFIGLSGGFTKIQKAARSLGISVDAPVKEDDGSVTVNHGAHTSWGRSTAAATRARPKRTSTPRSSSKAGRARTPG